MYADGVIERALRQADHLRANADAPFVERFNRHLVALADLAEHAGARDAAVFEQQFAGAAGADAQLVFLPAHRESRQLAFDEERRDAAIAGLRVHRREHDEEACLLAVGDPELAAVEHKPVRRFGGAGAQRKGVAA